MSDIQQLLRNNRAWAADIKAREPDFFSKLAKQQAPEYLWIGCSDSRVPANQITGLLPGEVFVHRNVANVVVHTDFNCLSVIQFAVEVLKVKHILVVGHYGCGGVQAALLNQRFGLIDNWLRNIQDVRNKHAERIEAKPEAFRAAALCELNVIEQAVSVCHTTIVHDAWERGQELSVHGWVYAVSDGLIRDLHLNIRSAAEIESGYRRALATVD